MRALDERNRILELLDLLLSVRKGHDKFVIVAVDLTTNFVEQPRRLAFEEPDHVVHVSTDPSIAVRLTVPAPPSARSATHDKLANTLPAPRRRAAARPRPRTTRGLRGLQIGR